MSVIENVRMMSSTTSTSILDVARQQPAAVHNDLDGDALAVVADVRPERRAPGRLRGGQPY